MVFQMTQRYSNMARVDDMTLMAYVDGELDSATEREIEGQLFRDPGLAARARALRETNALLAAAYKQALHEPDDRAQTHSYTPQAKSWPLLPMAASLAALAVGGMLGFALAGSGVGSSAALSDESLLRSALQQTLETELSGSSLPWRNADTGNRGQVTPVSTYRNERGQYCREFEEERVVAGVVQQEGGVACRGSDGTWRVRIRYYP